MYDKKEIDALAQQWKNSPRWKGIERGYTADKVVRLRGSLKIPYPLAEMGASKLWNLLTKEPFVRAMGAVTGNQAVQQVDAGLKAIYLSGWQVAADANDALQTYPDQSLYPVMSVPHLITRINNAFKRADEIEHLHNNNHTDWFVPIVADAEAGFGGPLNTLELIKAMIVAGAAAVHLEDQVSSLKKCGHMGGKVLEPIPVFVEKLIAARLAADILDVPILLIARTDAESASYIRTAPSPIEEPFLTGERSPEGYYGLKGGIDLAVARACVFAPYSDILWCETSKPDISEAKAFAKGVHEKFPGKWLAYNCSPSFNWKKHLDDKAIGAFQEELGALGYKFQFITLAGFHALNASMFELAKTYAASGMKAYADFQTRELALEKDFGYKAVKHQSFVGTGYFDELLMAISEDYFTIQALKGSTEETHFN